MSAKPQKTPRKASKRALRPKAASGSASSPFYVAGLGASAGGLEALRSFFAAMPADSGVAFVVVQHLAPDHRSQMAELLGSHTEMPAFSHSSS